MSRIKVIISIVFLGLVAGSQLFPMRHTQAGQVSAEDSLSIEQVISLSIQNYPAVKDADEAVHAADYKIALAKAPLHPEADIQATYVRVGPVPAFDLPGLGSMELAPYNNYDADINFRQRLFDFGKTNAEVNYEQKNKIVQELSASQVKQRVSLTAITTYYALLYLQEALKIKNEQLANLQSHLDYIIKKEQTGSATQYEILATKVKISGIESQKLDLAAAQKIQLATLNALLNQPAGRTYYLKQAPVTEVREFSTDSLLEKALTSRDEVKQAIEKEKLNSLHYDVVAHENNPVLTAFGSAGAKNGYEPDIQKLTVNFTAGLGLRVPILDGGRSDNRLLLASSAMKSSAFQTELLKKNITTEVTENEANLAAAGQKVKQFIIQFSQAEKAHALADVSFKAGVITNLDLLDATTALSESKLYLLKAQIDYQLNLYKVKAAVGDQLY
jgi:outer membrane protein TolC